MESMSQTNPKTERLVIWSPAWDKRSDDPSKNYGVHGMELRFVLKGPQGATQFVVYTNWMLPHLRYGHKKIDGFLAEPLPADLGYHALVPQYEGQERSGPCKFLDGRPCYYDGSGLRAQGVFDKFVAEGEDSVWKVLEQCLADLDVGDAP